MLAQPSNQFASAPMPSSYIELHFPTRGRTWFADQNHRLLGAIAKQHPTLHHLEGLAINTISGIPDKQGNIELTKRSRLSLRCPSQSLLPVLTLAGTTLTIDGRSLSLEDPKIRPLRPVSELKARLVTIKHPSGKFKNVTPEWFLGACNRQLQALGIEASVGIPADEKEEPARKTLRIKRQTIVGYSVIVANLLPKDSVLLQAKGIGGKRRMGCGYFVPFRLNG
ncbi:type I-MYXAN CRISPR-associated protein Cas6/Cmx6 [Oxynema sp. CENA135]|uniref:type I-MYXAN CRISPR-associated protein Cas6/Cmx6 n=1 Tax=Oxynema sp. CENA135 TaxID=984206 RepID=UPI00190C0113|nr:type I-MYXAN CRISPR-associated protein Cas6/Cmx6 [Oxynema sp. CENA135]MBK4731071.1 type I-MYXAN CRISPR-associated protein Cas6/Cmx6 [Oxynema sp. CENA135]